jgi:hypothetical protein
MADRVPVRLVRAPGDLLRWVVLGAGLLAARTPAHGATGPSFAGEVAPLLRARCLRCHSGPRPRGDLNLTTRAGMLAGGARGPVLAPGRSADSRLFTHLRDRKMPPRDPLPAAEVELVRRWVDSGAPWEGPALKPPRPPGQAGPDWWSLRPVRTPAIPAVKAPCRVRNPIDAFVLARLESKGLTPAPETDRRTYVRRVTLDLTGLPPTPEEVDDFLRDRRPDAYERLVDRLLASPAYGERWARHWLDVVRFAESHGYEMNTLRQSAWPYRDYVIRAFNSDTPYSQFIKEQLAGDVVGRGDPLTQSATGFLVAGPHDLVGNATEEGKLQQRADDLFDMVTNTGATFLGLTVGCARCHDHKFDPIPQKDFYSLQAALAGVDHAERALPTPEDARRRREAHLLRGEIDAVDHDLDRGEPLAASPGGADRRPPVNPHRNVERFAPVKARFVRFTVRATTDGTQPCVDELEVYGEGPANLALASAGAKASASSVFPGSPLHKLEHVNDGRYGNGRSWISNESGKGWVQVELPRAVEVQRVVWGRDREGKFTDRLAKDYRVEVSADGKVWKAVAGSWDRRAPGSKPTPASWKVRKLLDRRADLAKRLARLEEAPKVYAGVFRTPDAVHRLKRGDVMQKLEEVGPGVLASVKPALAIKPTATDPQRRLALAEWIAHPDNPLTARVLVNRVWHWHFGQGLVRTPSDFGFNGDRPSHPELLDWLARQFQSGGGRLKSLHRLIVLSATYRQAGTFDPKKSAVDSGNRLLWRYNPRRLEAEVIRDSMLRTSGALDRRMGGAGYHLWDYSGYVIVFKPKAMLGPETFRRMVYQFKPRLQQDGTFGAFDCPDATAAAPRRNVSTTALQALNLLNDPFVLDQAERFAARVRAEAGPDTGARVRRAFRLAFGRAPSAKELAASEKLVRTHDLPLLCRVLFNANEFVFVD